MYEKLMEQVVSAENYQRALEAVKRNQGAAGIDRMRACRVETRLDARPVEEVRA